MHYIISIYYKQIPFEWLESLLALVASCVCSLVDREARSPCPFLAPGAAATAPLAFSLLSFSRPRLLGAVLLLWLACLRVLARARPLVPPHPGLARECPATPWVPAGILRRAFAQACGIFFPHPFLSPSFEKFRFDGVLFAQSPRFLVCCFVLVFDAAVDGSLPYVLIFDALLPIRLDVLQELQMPFV